MARFCSACGASLPEAASSCPSCNNLVAKEGGTASAVPVASTTATSGLSDNAAGAIAYITFIPALLFLLLEPYRRRKFVRFHAFQCIFFNIAYVVLHIALVMFPGAGWALSSLVSFAALALWVVLVVKAYQGQWWKLPLIGEWAEKQANAV